MVGVRFILWGAFMVHPLRDQARAMRRAGATYSEIQSALGIGKGALSYMLRGIVLTTSQERRIQNKVIDNQNKLVQWFAKQPVDKRKSIQVLGGKNSWNKHEDIARNSLSGGNEAANMAYRKDELPMKNAVERHYGIEFHKEKINNRYIDFACEELLIEYTKDGTHGTFDLVQRFEDVSLDKRKKIAYLDTRKLGEKNRLRLESIGVVILDYRALA